ncbi:MAG: NAD(P)H-dependent oxidoreductase [Pseudomonadota bacterium]
MREAFLGALRLRHACRAFEAGRTVPAADLDYILEAGRLSPSSMGLEPWRFIVVESPVVRARLEVACEHQPHVGQCPVIVVIVALTADLHPESDYVRRMLQREMPDPEALKAFLGYYREYTRRGDLTEWSVAQCHLAAANMMTAAAAAYVDSCPIGGFDPAQVCEVLGIDERRYEVALLLALGYRAGPQPERQRLPLAELVLKRL